MTFVKSPLIAVSPPLAIACALSLLFGALADARAQGVPQADDTEVPAGQPQKPRVTLVVKPPSPPAPVALAAPPAPPPPGRRELVSGGLLLGLSILPLTAGIVSAVVFKPVPFLDCSKHRSGDVGGCNFNNGLIGAWDVFTYLVPTAGMLAGVGLGASGSALLRIGARKKERAIPTITLMPQGSALRPGGAMLTISGQF